LIYILVVCEARAIVVSQVAPILTEIVAPGTFEINTTAVCWRTRRNARGCLLLRSVAPALRFE
jgi:hypothetical protein